jgi:hypothetical protein
MLGGIAGDIDEFMWWPDGKRAARDGEAEWRQMA